MITVSEIANRTGLLFACSAEVDAKDFTVEKRRLPERFSDLGSWYFCVVDLTAVTHLSANSNDMELLVEQDLKLAKLVRPRLLFAIIASADHTYGISRMWQAVSDVTHWQTTVVRDRASATAWLRQRVRADYGIDLPPLTFDAPSPSEP